MTIKYVTDYGVLIELFMGVLTRNNPKLVHKSFMKKTQNKLNRYHKRRQGMCSVSEQRVKVAVGKAEEALEDLPQEISLGAICWLIHNRHKEVLKPYGFEPQVFEQMNRYYQAQGVILQTAKVLNKIEEFMYEDRD